MTTRPGVFISFVGDAASLERSAMQARSALAQLERQTQTTASRMGASMQKAGASMASTGRSLSRFVTLPLLGIGAAAVKMTADYERSLNTFQAVTGASGKQMAAMSTLAKQLGNDITLPGTSAKDAADAMTELGKAGLTVTDTFASAKGVLQLSAAAQIDNASAATITANALNSFKLAGDDAIRVADLLAATANSSSAEITDVADAFKMASAVFSTNNQKIEDLSTAIGILANAGIKGSDAGTALKTMLLRLAAPTDKAADAMRRLGIDVFDSQGRMIPFEGIVRELRSATQDLSQEQRAQALNTIFGADAIRVASIFATEGAGSFGKMREAVTRQGAAAEVAGAKMKGMGGALEALRSVGEGALIAIGEALAPTVRKVASALTGILEAFQKLGPGTQSAIVGVAAGLAALGPGLFVLGKLTSGVGRLASAFGAAQKASGALASVNAALTALGLNPVGLLIIGLVAAAAAAFVFRKQILNALKPVGRFFVRLWEGARDVFVGAWQAIVDFGKRTWDAISGGIRSALAPILPIVRGVLGVYITLWKTAFMVAATVVRGAFTIISEVVRTGFALIRPFIVGALGVITFVFKSAWALVAGTVRTAWEIIRVIVKAGAAVIRPVISGLVSFIRAIWAPTWRVVSSVVGGAWAGIKATVVPAVRFVASVITTVLGGLKRAWSDIWGALKGIVTGAWNGIKGALRTGVNFLISVINRVIGVLNTAVDAVDKALGPFINFPEIPTLPSIPAFARGGRSSGGPAIVGERGPEVVNLPRGATVTPNSALGSFSRAADNLTPVAFRREIQTLQSQANRLTQQIGQVIINVNGAQDPKKIAQQIRTELLRLGRRNVTVGLT